MRRSSTDLRGTTLLEGLLYGALLLLVLGALYGSLRVGLDAWRRTENFADLQQQAMAGLRLLADELAGSPRRCVAPEPGAVVLLTARDPSGAVRYDASGRVLWQAWVLYDLASRDGGPVLIRQERPLAPTPEVPDEIPTVAALRADSSLPRVVARGVTTLDFHPGPTLEVRLVASDDRWGGTSVQLLDRIWFRQ